MPRKYELVYFTENGTSEPMGEKEVKELLSQHTGRDIQDKDIESGQIFPDGNDFILINTFEDIEEEAEDNEED